MTHRHREVLDTFITSLFHYFMDFVNIGTVFSLGQLSNHLRVEAKGYLDCLLHTTMRPWIAETIEFRQLMMKVGAVISGSVALGAVLYPSFHSDKMDLYVGYGRGREDIIRHLISREQYAITATHMVAYGPSPSLYTIPGYYQTPRHVRCVTTLTRATISNRNPFVRIINIVESNSYSPLTPIFAFNATWMMNYLTATGLYVAYPKLTLRRQGIWCRTMDHSAADWAWRMISSRIGFKELNQRHLRASRCGAACPGLTRTSEDRWWMAFSTDDQHARRNWMRTWIRDCAGDCWDVQCRRFNLDIYKARYMGVSIDHRVVD